MKRIKRIASLLLALALAFSLAVGCFAQDAVITRGEAAKLLLTAADDYCPDLKTEDILKGYPDVQERRQARRALQTLPRGAETSFRARWQAAS